MRIVRLAPLYLPPAEYFRAMSDADMAVFDISLSYDKRFKAIHRTTVSSSKGPSLLTVPVTVLHKPSGRRTYQEVCVSAHGEWWRVQRMTLATLFGPTPYFDLYRHDIFPHIDQTSVGKPITDLNIDLILAIRKLCGITTPLSVTLDARYENDSEIEIVDMRNHDFYAKEGAVSVLETIFKEGNI